MQYVSPITKDNDIVNKKYVDENISAVNSEIEKVNTNLVNAINEVASKGDKRTSTLLLDGAVNSVDVSLTESIENYDFVECYAFYGDYWHAFLMDVISAMAMFNSEDGVIKGPENPGATRITFISPSTIRGNGGKRVKVYGIKLGG